MQRLAPSLLVSTLLLGVHARTANAQCHRAELAPPTPIHHAFFGEAIALDGDRLLVGEPGDATLGPAAGTATVFERSGGLWTAVGQLFAADGTTSDVFGRSVALAGDIAVVGAPHKDSSTGAAYVFEHVGGSWIQTAKLTPSGPLEATAFGAAVAVGPGLIVIGAPHRDDHAKGIWNVGAIYLFERPAGTWIETGSLQPSDGTEDSRFGLALDLDGGRMLVGAPYRDEQWNQDGVVYALEGSGGSWSIAARIDSPSGNYTEHFGITLALDGDRALIGAPGFDGKPCDGGGWCDRGTSYLFERIAGTWTLTATLRPGVPDYVDRVGSAVALQGDVALVGAEEEGALEGAAYLFREGPDGWMHTARLTSPDPAYDERYGSDLAIDGATLAVASDQDNYGVKQYVGSVSILELAPPVGTNYCTAVPNSTGKSAVMGALGSTDVGEGCLYLHAWNLRPELFGFFLVSAQQGFVPNPGGSQGNLCLGGTIGRFLDQVDSAGLTGSLSAVVDLSDLPGPLGPIQPGDTWYFTAWYRDKNPSLTSNFADGLGITFQ